jgi:hypothetical protein
MGLLVVSYNSDRYFSLIEEVKTFAHRMDEMAWKLSKKDFWVTLLQSR